MTEVKQDLLIVTDEGDFLRKQALRMIYALQNVYPDYTAEVRRFSDHRYIPELINFSYKKLVFLTWGYDSYQKLYTTKFLKSSTVRRNNDRYMLTLTKDLDGKPIDILDVHFDEFNDNNRMSVNNIRLVDTWWPQMVAFLFDKTAFPMCKPKWEYHTRTVSGGEKLVKCVDVVKTCMDYFNVKINSQPVLDYRGCNVVLCSGNFPQGENETDGCVYISDSYMATETTPNQYNKEHWLAGVLRIYSKTGVVKKPLKESVVNCTIRALDKCGLIYCSSRCWAACKSGFKSLSKNWQEQCMILSLLALPLCILGTGLPYWSGLIIRDGYLDETHIHILYGLFKRCVNHIEFSAYLGECAVHTFDITYNTDARRGGGGSRGGSRGIRSGGSSSTSRVRTYTGSRYTSGSWKTAAALGTLYGVTSYQRRRLYRDHPNREPQVCFNEENLRNGTYGYFICPEEGQEDSLTSCCGEDYAQYCCKGLSGGAIAGIVLGVMAFFGLITVGIICCVIKSRNRANKQSNAVPVQSWSVQTQPTVNTYTVPTTTPQTDPPGYSNIYSTPYSGYPDQANGQYSQPTAPTPLGFDGLKNDPPAYSEKQPS